MLRPLLGPQLLSPLICNVLPVFTTISSLQQTRGAKAQAKQKTSQQKKGKQQGKQTAAKKAKQKLETKPFDEKDPLNQKIIAMLVPQAAEPEQKTRRMEAEKVQRAKEHSRQKMKEHLDWMTQMKARIQLKKAAIQHLPPDLRAAALRQDLQPFPLTRHFLYDSPPEAYRD